MNSLAKIVSAVTALLIAVTGLLTQLSGDDNSSPPPVLIILDSPEAYKDFLTNHPSNHR